MDALLDVDDLRDPAIRNRRHQFFGLFGGNAAQFGQQFDGLRLGLRPGLVQILVEAHADPGLLGLDAREVQRLALDDFHGDVEFLVSRFQRREIDFAIALAGVGIASPQ